LEIAERRRQNLGISGRSRRDVAFLPPELLCSGNGGDGCAEAVLRVACRVGFSGWAEFVAEVVAVKVCQAFAAGIICEADTTRAVRTGFNRLTAAGGDFTISVLTIGNSGRC
jgi:hypothetical protein